MHLARADLEVDALQRLHGPKRLLDPLHEEPGRHSGRHVTGLLAPGATLFFTQTFHHRRSRLREKVKPLLRHVVTIDFGRVTYEEEFRAVLAGSGLTLREMVTLGSTRTTSYRLASAVPDGAA